MDPKLLGRVFPQPQTFKHFVRCCNQVPIPECYSNQPCSKSAVTYDEAVELCNHLGMSLCDELQLTNICCKEHDRCQNNDNKWVWVVNTGMISLIKS